jgi:hypothetical protein
MKIVSRIFMIAVIFLIHSCNEPTGHENTEDNILKGLESTLPEGWRYSKIDTIDTTQIPNGLTTPEQVFTVYKEEHSLSVLLFFYNVKLKPEIDSTIQEQAMSSWCTPVFFAESTGFYVVTSPCFIHSSSVAETGMEVESVLAIVKKHIENQ